MPVLVLATAAVVLSACGGSPAPVNTVADLALPTAPSPHVIAAATFATSPDGGIYRNPDPVRVVYLGPIDTTTLASRLGTAASDWPALRRFGSFEAVGMVVSNDGKAGSDPSLNDLQIASDFAPSAAGASPLRHYYHPLYPVAALSSVHGSQCGVHLDPGQSAVVVLVYPPIRPAPRIIWGRYGETDLLLTPGGALPSGSGALALTACAPPTPPPPGT